MNNYSQKSPSAEKLDEMPDYETTNGVFDRDTRIPTTVNNILTHSDSFQIKHIMEEKLK